MASAQAVRRFENISTLQSRVKTLEAAALPARYVIPASVVGSIEGNSSLTLPVIDLAGLRSGNRAVRAEIGAQIGRAAEDWGFFQVVNHGFPDEKMHDLHREAREFFELPVDVKERVEDPFDYNHGYEGRMENKHEKAPWLEYLAQWYRPTPTVEAMVKKIWPEHGNPDFCKAIHEYCDHADRLGRVLMELLAENLGLEASVFTRVFEDPNYRSSWRLHHYPPCPDPSRTLGAPPHSDTGILTILKQDAVSGLQVRNGDSYVTVPPLPGALVINVGVTFEAWSNGKYQSAEHRVVVNEKISRFSLVYLMYAPQDLVIECPPELINDANPSIFLPFTYGEYRRNFEKLCAASKTTKSDILAFARRSGAV